MAVVIASSSISRKRIAISLLLIVTLACFVPPAEAKSNSKKGSPAPSPSGRSGTSRRGGGLLWLLLLLFLPGILLLCCVMKLCGCICGGAAAVAKGKQDAKKFEEVKASDEDFLSGKLPGPLLGSAAAVGPGTSFALPGNGGASLWVGSYMEDGRNNSTNYYINFGPDGSISGSGQDQDGQFLLSGRSNISTGRFVWTEDISNEGVKVAVQLQGLPQGPDGAITLLQGTYCGTTGVFGPLDLVATGGQSVEMTGLGPQHVQVGIQGEAPPGDYFPGQGTAPPPQQYGMPPPPAGNYYPPPPPNGYAPVPPAGYHPAGAPPPPAGFPGA